MMQDEVKAIHFNTGRFYRSHGQRISAVLYADGRVLFNDHSRVIGGEMINRNPETFSPEWVMHQYDKMFYTMSCEALGLKYQGDDKPLNI